MIDASGPPPELTGPGGNMLPPFAPATPSKRTHSFFLHFLFSQTQKASVILSPAICFLPTLLSNLLIGGNSSIFSLNTFNIISFSIHLVFWLLSDRNNFCSDPLYFLFCQLHVLLWASPIRLGKIFLWFCWRCLLTFWNRTLHSFLYLLFLGLFCSLWLNLPECFD